MGLKITEQFSFGGVSSRDNPINQPVDRFLRVRNFRLTSDRHIELREGYSEISMSAVSAGLAHSMIGYKIIGGVRYAVFAQGSSIKLLNLATGEVTTPAFRGTPMTGTGRWTWYLANNRLHGTNGRDKKFLDGTTLRDIGVRAPTDVEAAAVTVTVGAANPDSIPATSVGGAQPGYQFYMSYWNLVTGQIGNRIKIGDRVAPDPASDIGFTGLPDLSAEDTELVVMIGRTGDGAEVSYAVTDANEDWVYVPNGQTTATVNTPGIDGALELPTQNGLPPATLAAVARAGDYAYGIVSDGPWVYRTLIGVDDQDGIVGRPEQSWPGMCETFPTGDVANSVQGYNGDVWIQSLEDLAILVDQQGVPGWQGPWNGAGSAGQLAFTPGWKGLPFWVNGHKQLMTMTADGPIGISDEYEAALLSQIGDAYLSETEVVPYRDAQKQLEILVIKCRDVDGNPFLVIHDFNARDERSPYGQAVDVFYSGPLASDFSVAVLRDNAGHARLWAGASNGRLYQLFDGVSDGGEEFTADLIGLVYIGPDRTAVPIIEWYGDANLQIYVSDVLDKTPADLADFTQLSEEVAETVPGDDQNPHYRVQIPAPEMIHCYLWLRLVSHSADAPAQGMGLSNPPHMPLESYGRVYAASPLIGTSRGK